MSQPLGRVADPKRLDGDGRPRARLSVAVPAEWLEAGALELRIVAPRRLTCDRCDGGGCDGCDRSGALRAPEDGGARVLSVYLGAEARNGARVRIADPFEGSDIAQLIVEISAGELSDGVERVGLPSARKLAVSHGLVLLVLCLALGLGAMTCYKSYSYRGATPPASPR